MSGHYHGSVDTKLRARCGLAPAVVGLFAVVVHAPFAQTQAPAPAGPTFDVVSIKKNTAEGPSRFMSMGVRIRPDGGVTMTAQPVGAIINRAYQSAVARPLVGLPNWATSDAWDVAATSMLAQATPEQLQAMLRAMLADRFKLVVHTERRVEDAYDLVLARADGRLGSALSRIEADCDAQMAATRPAFERPGDSSQRPPMPDFNAPPPPCALRTVGAALRKVPEPRGDVLEGEGSMRTLAQALQVATVRPVVDKTGLLGSYRMSMMFDMMALRRGPAVELPPDAPPSVVTALPEQLGLALKPSKAEREVLVVDRLERPSEN